MFSPEYRVDDTIVAAASASGAGIRGIVRVSGPDALVIARRLARFSAGAGEAPAAEGGGESPAGRPFAPGRVHTCRLSLPPSAGSTGGLACGYHAFALVWPGSRSYTGQPTVEFHLPAPGPLVENLIEQCTAGGARLARPGEFTLRGFLAGRFDLVQAEAVLGLIEARDRKQFDVALRQMAGGLTGPFRDLRERLLGLLAELEAGLDFVEEDIEFISHERLQEELAAACGEIGRLQRQLEHRGICDEVPSVVLVGPPNVGKSSLFNALAGRDVALVANEAGTTRDWLEAEVTWSGKRIRLIDTAGTADWAAGGNGPAGATGDSPAQAVEDAAVQQTRGAAGRASLLLVCSDGRDTAGGELALLPVEPPARTLAVRTKADLPVVPALPEIAIAVSVFRPESVDALRQFIIEKLAGLDEHGLDAVPATLVRCRTALAEALNALASAIESVRTGAGEELVAADIRVALDAVGEVAGDVCTEDLLDRIFRQFCIGK